MTTLREEMKREMILRGLSLGTQKLYLSAVTKLYHYYQRSLVTLTEDEIKAFLLFVVENKQYSAGTYNVIVHGLRFFYEIVLNKPMIAIKLPRQRRQQKLPDILSKEEVEKIIKATKNLMYKALFIIIYGAGLRVSEAVSLRVSDIDSARSTIRVRQGKGNKDRYIILSPCMLKALRLYWKKCRLPVKNKAYVISNHDSFIFPGATGKGLSTIAVWKMYHRSKGLAGIKKNGGVHALRHAFATHALESGINLHTISQLLGHKCIQSTGRYLHLTDKTLQKISSPIEALDL